MNLTQAIRAAGMADELKKKATPSVLNTELMQWLKAHPKLKAMEIHWPPSPSSLRYVRKEFDCSAGRGGKRPTGQSFYNVSRLKNKHREPFSV
jgi:hypothetical protein